MMRWGNILTLFVVLVFTLPFVLAHKSPIIEYGKQGMWRTEYTFTPRQAVVDELIILRERVTHPQGEIDGNVTMTFSVYEDDSVNRWYGGKPYKELHWLLIKSGPGQPQGDNTFTMDFIVDRPGNYFVTVDMYENGQYIGQDMRAVDVEKRTISPLYVIFNIILIAGVIWGVKKRIL